MNHEHLKKDIAKYDYIEGREATENFNRVAAAVSRAKKTVVQAAKERPKKESLRKSGKGKA